jgi:hypothetical protein
VNLSTDESERRLGWRILLAAPMERARASCSHDYLLRGPCTIIIGLFWAVAAARLRLEGINSVDMARRNNIAVQPSSTSAYVMRARISSLTFFEVLP